MQPERGAIIQYAAREGRRLNALSGVGLVVVVKLLALVSR